MCVPLNPSDTDSYIRYQIAPLTSTPDLPHWANFRCNAGDLGEDTWSTTGLQALWSPLVSWLVENKGSLICMETLIALSYPVHTICKWMALLDESEDDTGVPSHILDSDLWNGDLQQSINGVCSLLQSELKHFSQASGFIFPPSAPVAPQTQVVPAKAGPGPSTTKKKKQTKKRQFSNEPLPTRESKRLRYLEASPVPSNPEARPPRVKKVTAQTEQS